MRWRRRRTRSSRGSPPTPTCTWKKSATSSTSKSPLTRPDCASLWPPGGGGDLLSGCIHAGNVVGDRSESSSRPDQNPIYQPDSLSLLDRDRELRTREGGPAAWIKVA